MSVAQRLISTLLRINKRALSTRPPSIPPLRRAKPPRGMQARAEHIAGVPCFWLGNEESDTVLVYLHGGAYSGQAVSIQWRWIAKLSSRAATPALLVDYPLSSEKPFPAARDTVRDIVTELKRRAIQRVILIGDSAGGGLAVAAATELGSSVDAMVLISPWLDVTMTNPAHKHLDRRDAMLSISTLRFAGTHYAGNTDPLDPGISPLFADPGGLPPTIVHVGDEELFLPDVLDWTARVNRAGGSVELHVIHGGFHVSPIALFVPESRRAMTQNLDFLIELR